MRQLSEAEAHRARAALLDGKFPEGMQARCSWCGRVQPVGEGAFVTVKYSGTGPARVFKCSSCLGPDEADAA